MIDPMEAIEMGKHISIPSTYITTLECVCTTHEVGQPVCPGPDPAGNRRFGSPLISVGPDDIRNQGDWSLGIFLRLHVGTSKQGLIFYS